MQNEVITNKIEKNIKKGVCPTGKAVTENFRRNKPENRKVKPVDGSEQNNPYFSKQPEQCWFFYCRKETIFL
jgi:hypothetical protein